MKSNKQYEDKKRDCYELLSYLESNYKEQYDEILKIIGSSSDDGVHGFIICARNNALNIYHYGQSVAKIYLVEDKDNNKTPRYEVSDFFITGKKTGNKSTYKELSFGEFTKCYGTIIKNVVKNATGKRDDVEKQQVHRERICQQWIMNNCNKSKESDWYYIDMEYVDAIRPFGRFDMVAVRKTPKNGKHEVALVELKVTNGAYGTTLSTSKNLEKQKIIERKYDILKENLFAKDTDKEDYSMYELEKVKYGSGIVSHIADYLRYLNSGQYSLQLKQEIINAIKVYKKLGILPDDKLNDIDTLADLEI